MAAAAIATPPANEPEHAFAPKTAERAALERALSAHEVVDIPLVIGGERILSGAVDDVRAPHDRNRLLARVHKASGRDVQRAIALALEAAGEWALMPLHARASIFLKAADLAATKYRVTLNAATMLGQSKTLDEAEPDSACELIDFLRFNAYNAQRIHDEQPLSTASAVNRADWRPLEGFVYAVSPFNFTAIGANLSTAPALMGNVVLWKPSPKSVLSNYRFFEILEEAGLPPGVINFVPGDAPLVTEIALGSEHFTGLHFTGSSTVFRDLWSAAGQRIARYRGFPRLVGETGGKGFVLAHASADVDSLVAALVRGAFEYQGQKCSAASRAYVPRSLWPGVRDGMLDQLRALRIGDVADTDTFMGAVIDRASYERLEARLRAARSDPGARVIAGGNCRAEPGYFVEPTVLEVTDPRHALMSDELFGPILTVYVYDDSAWADVLPLVDGTSTYALTGSIFAMDRRALAAAESALVNAAGNLYVNDKPTGAVIGQQPFGGTRGSGTNDKAGSWMNLLRWTSARIVKDNYARVEPARMLA
jgi:1-pyrroline-5-carboxylate dehydrogenase